MLLEGQECTNVSHTGEWISGLVLRVIEDIGPSRIGSVSADNTRNTRVAREIICRKLPQVLNLPDPEHFINNVWKEIANLPFWSTAIETIRRTLKYFKHANLAKSKLRQLRSDQSLGAGLESIGKTRFATLVWSALSVRRSLPAIRDLCSNEEIEIPVLQLLSHLDTPATLQFEILLTQFIAIGDPFARTIQCLEATSTNPADVYLYFIALVARLKQALETCHVPEDVSGQIRAIVNRRWMEFFVNGPSNAHRSAFYLNPGMFTSFLGIVSLTIS
ncbi:ribonuclease H-like domain-containing protein [Crepidotus variabilis]|uniref:Ribonuclease H-like domain-containing protein n=1 Tax=Crepidotus variabilis TaxID=179855 RepID=A0A9P6EC03_9AGAR|nr:ribonuclease H-like domain-containing protein [Crepidotus variabilis]